MSPSAKSLFYFGLYIMVTGVLFITVPERLLSFFDLPAISPGWASIIGFLATVLGMYDVLAGKGEIKFLIKSSIFTRLSFAMGIVLLVLFDRMPISILPFGVIDAIGAFWTSLALRSELAHSHA